MQRIWDAIRLSTFLRQNAVFFTGSVVVGALNYAYYPIMSHILPVSAYGEVQALVSLFLQLLIFLTVLGQVTVNIVANYQDELQKQRVVYELEKLALFVSIGLFIVAAACSWKIKSFFHFQSVWPFIVLMAGVVITVPLTFRSAFLKGHKRFLDVSLTNITSSVADIIISVVLVLIGWKTCGAITGVVLAQAVAFIYAARTARRVGFKRPENVSFRQLPSFKVLRPELKYGGLVLCGSLIITVVSSVDIFVVKHFFNATVAGHYAGVSMVARIIFFLTASITQVLLPSVKLNQTAAHNRRLFRKSLALVMIIGGSAALVFATFSKLIVTLLMGNNFAVYAYLLGRLSLVMLTLSVLNLTIFYFIALRRYQITVVVVAGAALTGVLLMLYHSSLTAIVNSLLFGAISMLALFGVWLGIRKVTKEYSHE